MKKYTKLAILSAALAPSLASAAPISFTPTSVLMPIKTMDLMGDDGTSSIISCAGTEEECMIDLADNDSLEAKFADGISVTPGTYDRVEISTCDQSGGANTYNIKVKGTVEISGTTYVTKTTGILGTTGDPEYVSIPLSNCGGKATTLPSDLVIAEGDAVDLTLFLSTKNMVWASASGDTKTSGSDCVGTDGAAWLCTGYPDLVGYVGAVATPTAETYHIDFSTTAATAANGIVILIKDSSDTIIAGMSRKLFLAGSASGGCEMGFPFSSFAQNTGASTYDVTAGDPDGSTLLRFPEFERTASHSDTATCRFGTTDTYTAYQQ